jgi:hypothetical protein
MPQKDAEPVESVELHELVEVEEAIFERLLRERDRLMSIGVTRADQLLAVERTILQTIEASRMADRLRRLTAMIDHAAERIGSAVESVRLEMTAAE